MCIGKAIKNKEKGKARSDVVQERLAMSAVMQQTKTDLAMIDVL